jgi:dTDP-4-dehydrorhamnose reductase
VKKKVLLLGSQGMAGHVIAEQLRHNEAIDLLETFRGRNYSRAIHWVSLDIKDQGKLSCLLEVFAPDVIVNCAGMLVQPSNDNLADAILVNSHLPQYLAQYARDNGCRLIHISTDCVFSGKTGYYTESSLPDASYRYGVTKALGEVDDRHNLTIRTSIIGPELKPTGVGLFHWFMLQSGHIQGYADAFWSGVTTVQLAKFIEKVLFASLTGIYHLTNNQVISKFELLCLLKEIFVMNGIHIDEVQGHAMNKSLINTRDEFDFSAPGYREMLIEIKRWAMEHAAWYPHYKQIS